MTEGEQPNAGLLHGLVGELATGLRDAAGSPANPFPPQAPRDRSRPLLRVATAVAEPTASDQAREQAQALLEAAGLTARPRWSVSTPTRHVTLREGDSVRIGRSPRAELVVAHPEVSKFHCEIAVQAGKLVARDAGSTNGTELRRGGRSVRRLNEASVELQEGDRLGVAGNGPEIATIGRMP